MTLPDSLSALRVRALGLFCALVLGLAFASPSPHVVAAEPPASVDRLLDAARQQIDTLQSQLGPEASAESLSALRTQALTVQARTGEVAATLAPQLANVEARLAELGPVPAAPAVEAPDVTAQRKSLEGARSQLDAQVRLARLLSIEGEQTAEQITNLRRARFEAQLGERTPSILAPNFWAELRESWPSDAQRLRSLAVQLAQAARAPPALAWPAVLLAVAAAVALGLWAERALLRLASSRVPPGRLRRSLLALGSALVPTLATLLAAHAIRLGFAAGPQALTPTIDSLLIAAVGIASFGVYVAALGRALLSPSRPSWRLPPLPDRVAHGLRRAPWLLGGVIALGGFGARAAGLVNASLATTVAINCLYSLALGLLLAHVAIHGERLRREVLASPQAAQAPPRPLWLLVVVSLNWLALALSLAGLLAGFVALGSFAVKQVVWVSIVAATAYLLSCFVDDACTTWLGASPEPTGDAPADTPALRRQAAVLLSAFVRVTLWLVALVLVLAPFGQGPAELLQRAGGLSEGVAVGEIRVLPGSVLQALAVFGLGMVAVRLLQRWLLERYLPTTSLDAGMRISATTLLGYVGMVCAVALGLSAVGLGLERIAWVASALSVGIGFGLQAVVQNFVSGLILLTERPVKVGDWVSLGGIEGDIRRINVRATEIQMGDRSTVIVPNSEFITKTVRNVTHANPLGLVQIKLPMPLDTDVQAVRELLLGAFDAHPDVLDSPAPSVFLDGIEGAGLVFNASGSVASPRQAYGVRSALLFDVLARLKEAGLPLQRAPAMVLREAPAAATDADPPATAA